MNELDKLRPEVAHSVRCVDAEPFSDGAITHWPVVRADLLRLADENAQLHESAQGGYEDGWHALRNERDTLRAELAALKARITNGPIVSVRMDRGSVSFGARNDASTFASLHGKHAHLVAEDGEP